MIQVKRTDGWLRVSGAELMRARRLLEIVEQTNPMSRKPSFFDMDLAVDSDPSPAVELMLLAPFHIGETYPPAHVGSS